MQTITRREIIDRWATDSHHVALPDVDPPSIQTCAPHVWEFDVDEPEPVESTTATAFSQRLPVDDLSSVDGNPIEIVDPLLSYKGVQVGDTYLLHEHSISECPATLRVAAKRGDDSIKVVSTQ